MAKWCVGYCLIINELYDNEEFYFIQEQASHHYAPKDLRNEPFSEKRMERKGEIDWPNQSPDLTPLTFSVVGSCKRHCLCKKPEKNEE